ncbi:MAG: TlpA family protein disulfide reductase [Actinobacteria bacterium]|nr:TlpA family protein disulfide reductase [Actinomycetota bacterium]
MTAPSQPPAVRHVSRRAILAACFGGLAAAACGAGPTLSPATEVAKVSLPQVAGAVRQAADFPLAMYQGEREVGGATVSLRELLGQGKPVVLNFWSGNCPPCRVEMPDFERAYRELRGRILFVGVDVGPYVRLGSVDDGRRLVQELGITYPVGTTSEAAVVPAYRVLGMPTTAFITPAGRIVRQWTGILDYSALLRLVDELMAASQP